MLPKYHRILLKLSGESFMGNNDNNEGFDPFNPAVIEQYAQDIKSVTELGVHSAGCGGRRTARPRPAPG